MLNRAMDLPDKEELYGGKFDLEKEMYIDVKNYIREKRGLYYAVMVYTNVRGERKEKWFSTKLPVKGNKTKAEAFSRMILREFKILCPPSKNRHKIALKNGMNLNNSFVFAKTSAFIPRFT